MRVFIVLPVRGTDRQGMAVRAHKEAVGTQNCFCLVWLFLEEKEREILTEFSYCTAKNILFRKVCDTVMYNINVAIHGQLTKNKTKPQFNQHNQSDLLKPVKDHLCSNKLRKSQAQMPQYPVADEGSTVYQKQFTMWVLGTEFNGNQRCPPEAVAWGHTDSASEEGTWLQWLAWSPHPAPAAVLTFPHSACRKQGGQEPIKWYRERL